MSRGYENVTNLFSSGAVPIIFSDDSVGVVSNIGGFYYYDDLSDSRKEHENNGYIQVDVSKKDFFDSKPCTVALKFPGIIGNPVLVSAEKGVLMDRLGLAWEGAQFINRNSVLSTISVGWRAGYFRVYLPVVGEIKLLNEYDIHKSLLPDKHELFHDDDDEKMSYVYKYCLSDGTSLFKFQDGLSGIRESVCLRYLCDVYSELEPDECLGYRIDGEKFSTVAIRWDNGLVEREIAKIPKTLSAIPTERFEERPPFFVIEGDKFKGYSGRTNEFEAEIPQDRDLTEAFLGWVDKDKVEPFEQNPVMREMLDKIEGYESKDKIAAR